jgi:type IV fimbrial biogenesis protein FimT
MYRLPVTFSHKINGFTLLELLITISIAVIVTTIVQPSAQKVLQQSRITANINQMSGLIRFARTHAITQLSDITLCPSNNMKTCDGNWRHHLIVFEDLNDNQVLDNQERLLASAQALSEGHKIKGSRRLISFKHTGSMASPASLILCHRNNENTLARGIYVSLQGRVRLTKDSNHDGIHETSPGENIDCSTI